MQKTFIASLCLLLFSCSKDKDSISNHLIDNNNPGSYQASLNSYEQVAEELTEDDCDQIEPSPILNESFFLNHAFDLEDNFTAIETAQFPNGDKIFISYSGCEDRKMTIKISTFRYKGNKNDMKYWTNSIRNLLDEVQSNSNTSSEMEEELNSINQYLINHSLLKQKELIYSPSNPSHKFTFEGVEDGQPNSSIIHLKIELNELM